MWRKITGAHGESQRVGSCTPLVDVPVSTSLTGLVIMSDFQPDPLGNASAVATPPVGTEAVAEAFAGLQGRATQVLNAIDDGIFFLDRNGLTIFLNEAGARMLGFTLREVLGRSMHQLSHHHYADGSAFPAEECPILSS